ncbi:MAG: DUF721 domain-containing protein [Candidatus Marinimicrobia bacterium]|nr:DUF721 domain-containing protein [Candidatus Neomarinimicrobiota bacterium]
MPSLAVALAQAFKERGWTGLVEQQRSFQLWEEIVGPAIAANSRPIDIRDDVLIVQAKSAVWRSEIAFQKDEILAALNHRLKGNHLKDLKLK